MNHPFSVPDAIQYSQAHILVEIEDLVRDLAASRLMADFDQRLLTHLPLYSSAFSSSHVYSEYIDLFWAGCKHVRLFDNGGLSPFGRELGSRTTGHLYALTDLIGYVSAEVRGLKVTKCANDRRFQDRERREKLERHKQAIRARYARPLAVRVDFGYHIGGQYGVEIDDLYRHMRKMQELRLSRPDIFGDELGFAWALLQGTSSGYYASAVRYYPGTSQRSDCDIAAQYGQLWGEVTDGLGVYRHRNADEPHLGCQGTCGHGHFHPDDPLGVDQAQWGGGYLARPDARGRYLRMRPRNSPSFATGISRYIDRSSG
jgi:hypothetical protein